MTPSMRLLTELLCAARSPLQRWRRRQRPGRRPPPGSRPPPLAAGDGDGFGCCHSCLEPCVQSRPSFGVVSHTAAVLGHTDEIRGENSQALRQNVFWLSLPFWKRSRSPRTHHKAGTGSQPTLALVKSEAMLTRMLALRLPRPARAFSSATTDDAGRREDAESFSETSSRGNPADAALLQKILRRALVAEVRGAVQRGKHCHPSSRGRAKPEASHAPTLHRAPRPRCLLDGRAPARGGQTCRRLQRRRKRT